ncbi:MAG: leucine-rich repeat protein [Clostridia bacterium]|nr:leucine-rich repeat protein [Clostridia bacterium]
MRKTSIFKVILFIFILTIICLMSLGCQEDKFKLIKIVGEDEIEVEPGEYTLKYSLLNFDDLKSELGLSLSVYVYDKDHKEIAIKNNRTINVTANNEYEVTVIVYDKQDRRLKHSYNIKTVVDDVQVHFVLRRYNESDSVYEKYRTYNVEYGHDLSWELVPDLSDFENNETIMDYYNTEKDGKFITTIQSLKWVTIVNGEEVDLAQNHLLNIKDEMFIYTYGVFTYSKIIYSVKYYSINNEGNQYVFAEENDADSDSTLTHPGIPQRTGYAFAGWYLNEQLTNPVNWTNILERKVTSNMNIYASWVKRNTTEQTSYDYFDFTKYQDSFGIDFCVISAKNMELPENIVLPNSYEDETGVYIVTSIAEYGFTNSTGFKKVTIPDTYISLNRYAFYESQSLEEVYFDEESYLKYIENGCFYHCTNLKKVIFPKYLVSIGVTAFAGCDSYVNIELPEYLQYIEERAFYNVSNVVEISIPDHVRIIDSLAFEDCTNLETVVFSTDTNISSMENNIFNGTKVTSITLPKRLEEKEFFKGAEIEIIYLEEGGEEND